MIPFLSDYTIRHKKQTISGTIKWQHPDDSPFVAGLSSEMTPDERKKIEDLVWRSYLRKSDREGAVEDE